MGQRASDTTLVHFDNVRVPAEPAPRRRRRGLQASRWPPSIARDRRSRRSPWGSLGAPSKRASPTPRSARPSVSRSASSKGVQFMLADMAKGIEASRLLTMQSAWLLDRGAQAQPNRSAMAKCFATDVAMEATTDAVQVFGGNGYTKEYPGREADARRQADADLRGHQPDPARRDRPRADRGELAPSRARGPATRVIRRLQKRRQPCRAGRSRTRGRARRPDGPGGALAHAAHRAPRSRDRRGMRPAGGRSIARLPVRCVSALRTTDRMRLPWPASPDSRMVSGLRRTSPTQGSLDRSRVTPRTSDAGARAELAGDRSSTARFGRRSGGPSHSVVRAEVAQNHPPGPIGPSR